MDSLTGLPHEHRLGAAVDRLGETERAAVGAALPALFRMAEHLGDRPGVISRHVQP
ncbi:hypothetical protein [Streptomyces sp. NPDC086777]|uniref:hypothetical protein n=1 Tax=Streptomyces sp. NPDC086777 TaxID=3154866 RepID=UPI0034507C05